MSDTCENERQRQSLLQRGRPDVMICRDCYANYGGAPGTVLCPLHEATAELLAALKGIIQALESAGSGYVFKDDAVLMVIEPALEAIQKAEGR